MRGGTLLLRFRHDFFSLISLCLDRIGVVLDGGAVLAFCEIYWKNAFSWVMDIIWNL
jgi:hypothetical protein